MDITPAPRTTGAATVPDKRRRRVVAPERLGPAPATPAETPQLPPGPLSRAELRHLVTERVVREHYVRMWQACYRLRSQPEDLALRTAALARQCPQGVVCGRSAALLWGDDSAPEDAEPEIWLPRQRNSRPGRRYRSGHLSSAAVTRRDALAVTTLTRTCLDLARWSRGDDRDTPTSGGGTGALTVSLDRLGAANPGLGRLLAAYLAHPAGDAVTPAGIGDRVARRRLAAALAASDPRSPSAQASWARVWLTRRLGEGFVHRPVVVIHGCTLRPGLADPTARIVVEFRRPQDSPLPDEHGHLPQWLRERELLRAAGWTAVVVCPRHTSGHRPGPTDPAGVDERAVSAARALRQLWWDTGVLPPHDGHGSVLDPVGIWGGYSAAGACSGAEGSRW